MTFKTPERSTIETRDYSAVYLTLAELIKDETYGRTLTDGAKEWLNWYKTIREKYKTTHGQYAAGKLVIEWYKTATGDNNDYEKILFEQITFKKDGFEDIIENINLSELTRQEYAEIIIKIIQSNPEKIREVDLYEMVTYRPEFRIESLSDKTNMISKVFNDIRNSESQKIYSRFISELQVESDTNSQIDMNSGWVQFTIGDGRNNNIEQKRSKGYITIKFSNIENYISNLKNIIEELRDELKNNDYKGAFKIPEFTSQLVFKFDNLVFHGADDKDVNLALETAMKVLAKPNVEIDRIQTGYDIKNTEGKTISDSDSLVNSIIDRLKES